MTESWEKKVKKMLEEDLKNKTITNENGDLLLKGVKDEVKIVKGKELEKKARVLIQDKKEKKIDELLKKPKNPFKSMAIGEHGGHYYIGTMLYDEVKKRKCPAVVLDDGTCFVCWSEELSNEIKEEFNLNYRFELFDDCIDNLWSNQSILDFRNGVTPELDFKEMFEKIKNKNKELIYHVDDRIHSYISCDIISNYFYPLFNAKGRTYFQAEFGSGKSRQSLIYQKLSFNSLFASNISPASFERVIESTGGTIIVDNFDNCNEDLKRAILQCIEVYYKKGGKNIKADGQGKVKNKPIAFNGYSPLVINNIIGLPEVTESRCNKIQMLRTDKKNIVDIKIKDDDPFWNLTKDNLHVLALQRWKEVKEIYQNLEIPELSARDLERAEAVLTIAKAIGEETYREVLDFLLENNEQQSIRELHDDWEFIVYEYLNESLQEEEKDFKVKDIAEAVAHKIIKSDSTAKKDKDGFSRFAGKVLGNVGIFKKKTIHGWVHYHIKRKDLTKMIQIKKFDKYITLPHPTSPTPPNNTHNTPNIWNNKNNEENEEDKIGLKKKIN